METAGEPGPRVEEVLRREQAAGLHMAAGRGARPWAVWDASRKPAHPKDVPGTRPVPAVGSPLDPTVR
jgi:hypothetical protein